MLEKSIENYLDEQWRRRVGGETIKIPPLFFKGIPDRLCICWPGYFFFVETKAPRGVVSKIQSIIHARFLRYNIKVEVLYTKTMIDEFIDRVCEYITNPTHIKTKD